MSRFQVVWKDKYCNWWMKKIRIFQLQWTQSFQKDCIQMIATIIDQISRGPKKIIEEFNFVKQSDQVISNYKVFSEWKKHLRHRVLNWLGRYFCSQPKFLFSLTNSPVKKEREARESALVYKYWKSHKKSWGIQKWGSLK